MNATPTSLLITGASSGLGAALAEAYAAPGVTLYLTARDAARLQAVAARCEAKGARAVTACLDVREKAPLAAFITAADDATPLDLVIANAGISTGSFSGAETLDAAEAVFAVNVMGVLYTLHPIIPRMVARGRGQLAILASLASICALPGAPAYSASKAAVRYYGEALAGKLKPHGVRVSVICPGWIVTPLTDRNDFPMPFLMSAARAATRIQRGLATGKTLLLFPRRLGLPLLLLAALPHALRRALLGAIPEKRQKH